MKLFSKKLLMDGVDKAHPRAEEDQGQGAQWEEGREKRETEDPCTGPVFHNLRHLLRVRTVLIWNMIFTL